MIIKLSAKYQVCATRTADTRDGQLTTPGVYTWVVRELSIVYTRPIKSHTVAAHRGSCMCQGRHRLRSPLILIAFTVRTLNSDFYAFLRSKHTANHRLRCLCQCTGPTFFQSRHTVRLSNKPTHFK